MGQQAVLDFLKTNTNKWFIAREINRALGTTFSCTTSNLRRLREGKLIEFKKVGKRGLFVYKYIE